MWSWGCLAPLRALLGTAAARRRRRRRRRSPPRAPVKLPLLSTPAAAPGSPGAGCACPLMQDLASHSWSRTAALHMRAVHVCDKSAGQRKMAPMG